MLQIDECVGLKVTGIGTEGMGIERRGWVVLTVCHTDGRTVWQRRSVQAIAKELPNLMCSNISNSHDELVTQILLDKKIPAFDIPAAIVARSSIRSSADGKRDEAGGKIGRRLNGDTEGQWHRTARNRIDGQPVRLCSGTPRIELDRCRTQQRHALCDGKQYWRGFGLCHDV